MRQVGNEFGDLNVTANRWVRQVPTSLRAALEYFRVYRDTLEDNINFESLLKNTSTKAITVDGHDATQPKEFLLRPFKHEDRRIPENLRMDGQRTRGYILVNVALGEYHGMGISFRVLPDAISPKGPLYQKLCRTQKI